MKRVLLKLSGEALAGEKGTGIDPETVKLICKEIAEVAALGVELALVIGGGNIFRGLSTSAKGMKEVVAAAAEAKTLMKAFFEDFLSRL